MYYGKVVDLALLYAGGRGRWCKFGNFDSSPCNVIQFLGSLG